MTPPSTSLEIIRRFEAPAGEIFEAFSTYEAMAAWFGPQGCSVKEGHVDFRVGGTYRLVVGTPGGDHAVTGSYTEIEAPHRLAFTWRWEDDPDWADLYSQVSIQLTAKGDGTELRLTQRGFPSEESRGNHEHGWGGSFDKLA